MFKPKLTIILLLFSLSFVSINCGNRDDEDSPKEKKENLNIKRPIP